MSLQFHIGWPQGIYLALSVLSVLCAACLHGKPRDPIDVKVSIVSILIIWPLLWWGGFFG